jgi:hypothetical protein
MRRRISQKARKLLQKVDFVSFLFMLSSLFTLSQEKWKANIEAVIVIVTVIEHDCVCGRKENVQECGRTWIDGKGKGEKERRFEGPFSIDVRCRDKMMGSGP